MAIGKTAFGCGFTIVALPVIKSANNAGTVFQIGKVLQPITKATPFGMAFQFFSITKSNLPNGLLQVAFDGNPFNCLYPSTTASKARSFE